MRNDWHAALNLHEGMNSPSGIERVIVTGYYDGPTHGIIEHPNGGVDYAFEMINDEVDDIREFQLRPLRAGVFDDFVAIVSEYLTPAWPVWCPIWKFPTAEIQRDIDSKIDALLSEPGEPEWNVLASRSTDFREFTANRTQNLQPA